MKVEWPHIWKPDEWECNEVKQIDLFCPNCGNKTVYREIGQGDFYEGQTHYCKSCKNEFTMPSAGIRESLRFIE